MAKNDFFFVDWMHAPLVTEGLCITGILISRENFLYTVNNHSGPPSFI